MSVQKSLANSSLPKVFVLNAFFQPQMHVLSSTSKRCFYDIRATNLVACKKKKRDHWTLWQFAIFPSQPTLKVQRFCISEYMNFVWNNCSAVFSYSDISVGVANWHLSPHTTNIAHQTVKAVQVLLIGPNLSKPTPFLSLVQFAQ